MAGELTWTEGQGIAKRVYEKELRDYLPKENAIYERLPELSKMKRTGESYQVPLVVQPPNGVTYAGSDATSPTTLKQGRAMIFKQLSVKAFELDMREQVLWAALSRASQAGEAAADSIFSQVMQGMKKTAMHRLECQILFGQMTIGTVESVTDLGSNTGEIVFTAASWRPGLFHALVAGATLDSFTSTTKNNATGALILKKTDSVNRKITITYSGTLSSECAAGDTIWFEGAYTGSAYNEMPGLMTAANNTGTLHGLDAGTYPVLLGNTYAVGGNMSFDALEDSCSYLFDRGVDGELVAFFSPRTVAQLMKEPRTQRMLDSSYSSSKATLGNNGAEFNLANGGKVTLVGHRFCAWGEGLILDTSTVRKVGSSEPTFILPGSDGKEIFRILTDSNAAEFGLFADMGVVNMAPSHSLYLSGITFT